MDNLEKYQKAQEVWRENANLNHWLASGLIRADDPHVELTTALMLENQRLFEKYKPDTALANSYELVSRIMPNLLANKIVSVQPKISPHSISHYMRFVSDEGNIELSVVDEDMGLYTRELKTRSSEGVEEMSKSIVTELNNELLTDIFNNCGTIFRCGKSDTDSVYSSILTIGGYIFRKTLRAESKCWLTVTPKTYRRYSRVFDRFKFSNYKVHCVEGKDDCILMGRQGDHLFDHAYIWSPYIMVAKAHRQGLRHSDIREGLIIRYGKKLIPGGGKAFAKITLPEQMTLPTIIAKLLP